MALPARGAYHDDPRDAEQVGSLCQQHKATLLITTPLQLEQYAEQCKPEQLASLRAVVVAGDSLAPESAAVFEAKFGVVPREGYGLAETSSLIALNVADFRSPGLVQVGSKPGTVGRLLPGVAVKIVDPQTGEEQDIDQPGLLLVSGPCVMLGYLNQPEATAARIHDSWIQTGDTASIDADGFLTITTGEKKCMQDQQADE